MTDSEFEAEAIRLAMAGDAEFGFEVLKLCRSGLDNGRLSPELAYYLAERINDVLEGVQPEKALRIYKYKGPGKPADPFPEWQQHLGAFAALLTQRGYRPKQVALAMCDQRADIHDKSLEDADAHRIRAKWRPMQAIDAEILQHLAGPYCEILAEYPPLK